MNLRFVCQLLIATFLVSGFLISSIARAQNAVSYDEEYWRKTYAEEYAKLFAEEFSNLQKSGDFKDIYQYFLPRDQRDKFFRKFEITSVTAKGSVVTIVKDGKALEIDIVDMLEQRFKINGQPYTHDWLGRADVQLDVIRKAARTQKTAALHERIFDAVVPKADAAVPLLVAGAIQVCVEGGCQLAWMVGQRALLWAAANSSRVQVAAVAASPAVRTKIWNVLKKAYEGGARVTRYIYEDIATDPRMVNGYRAATKALSTPGNYVVAPFKAAHAFWEFAKAGKGIASGSIYVGAGTQVAGMYAQDIPFKTALECLANFQIVQNCRFAKPSVTVTDTSSGISKVLDSWCPTDLVNEIHSYRSENGVNVVRIWRTGLKAGHAGSSTVQGVPTEGFRFELDSEGHVKPETARYFEFSKSGEVTLISKIKFNDKVPAQTLLTQRKHLPDLKKEENDLFNQVTERNARLKPLIERAKSRPLFADSQEGLSNQTTDPLKARGNDQALTSDEQSKALDMKNTFLLDSSACDGATVRPIADPSAPGKPGATSTR